MIVGGLTTRHKLEISVCSCTDESRGLCSSSSRKYPGTEGTNKTATETISADMLQTVWIRKTN